MIPLIIHVPHASTAIPSDALADFSVPEGDLKSHVARMTDHFTDRLFALEGEGVTTVAFPINRIVLDPERFECDTDEPMAAQGQGVLYHRGADGSVIRPVLSTARRSELLERWYRPHHERLTAAVDDGLAGFGRVLIIDAHSFPDDPLPLDLNQSTPRPDACIGTEKVHTPMALIEAARSWCREHGWSLGVDAPYAGTLVPLKHYGKSPNVWSIMVEINRARYMRLERGMPVPSERFDETRAFVAGLMGRLRQVGL